MPENETLELTVNPSTEEELTDPELESLIAAETPAPTAPVYTFTEEEMQRGKRKKKKAIRTAAVCGGVGGFLAGLFYARRLSPRMEEYRAYRRQKKAEQRAQKGGLFARWRKNREAASDPDIEIQPNED